MICQMKGCSKKAVSYVILEGAPLLLKESRRRISELCMCRFHKLSWELLRWYDRKGVVKNPEEVEEEIRRRGMDAIAEQLGLEI